MKKKNIQNEKGEAKVKFILAPLDSYVNENIMKITSFALKNYFPNCKK